MKRNKTLWFASSKFDKQGIPWDPSHSSRSNLEHQSGRVQLASVILWGNYASVSRFLSQTANNFISIMKQIPDLFEWNHCSSTSKHHS